MIKLRRQFLFIQLLLIIVFLLATRAIPAKAVYCPTGWMGGLYCAPTGGKSWCNTSGEGDNKCAVETTCSSIAHGSVSVNCSNNTCTYDCDDNYRFCPATTQCLLTTPPPDSHCSIYNPCDSSCTICEPGYVVSGTSCTTTILKLGYKSVSSDRLVNAASDALLFVTSNKLGIGTDNPSSTVHIIGSANLSDDLFMISGKSIRLDSNTSTILYLGNYYNDSGFVYGASTNPVVSLQIEGDLRANRLCIQDSCKSSWTDVGGGYWLLSSSNLYASSTTWSVGIGTASPDTKLHIYDATSGPIISLSGLDSKYRGLAIKDTNNNEKWFIGNNTSNNFVIRATNSSDVLTINSTTGNVGIGTTPDATYKLSINGTIKTNLTSVTPGSYCLYVNQDGVIGAKTSDCGTATGGRDNLGDHTATQNIKLNGYWLSNDGGSEGVYVDTGGNVGIGASSSLGSRMVIKGSGSDSLASALNVQNSSGNSLLYVRNDGRVGIGSTSPSVSLVVNGNVIAGTPTADGHLATKAYVDSSVKLWVNNGTSLYASSTGWSVGIGTTSPDTKLHIYDATSGPIISLSGSDSNYRGLAIKNTSNNEKWFIGNNTSSNSFVIRANNSNDVLTVSSSAGNVGIGSSSPGYTLSVSGTGYFSNTVTAAPPTATGNVATKGYVDNLISELSVGPTIFVGLSTTVMSPNQSGYSGVNNNICQAVSSTSHLCTVEDILEIVNNGQAITIPTTSVGYWISNGPPGYTANANDCAGFTTSSPNFLGAVWMRNNSYPNGVGALRYCNATGYFACCK